MQYCVRPVYTTYANIACISFSPGGISVSEMKQTANISCLLHCRYYAVSSAADAWTAVRGLKETRSQNLNKNSKANDGGSHSFKLDFTIWEGKCDSHWIINLKNSE